LELQIPRPHSQAPLENKSLKKKDGSSAGGFCLLQMGLLFCGWVFFFCRLVLCECGNFESRSCKQDEKPTTTTKTKLPTNTEKPRSELQEGKAKARE